MMQATLRTCLPAIATSAPSPLAAATATRSASYRPALKCRRAAGGSASSTRSSRARASLRTRQYATSAQEQTSQSVANAAAISDPPSIPSNIPREDYATPAMYSLGIMGRLFRYSIYGSVFIVVGSATIYLSLHAYVEYIGLQGFRPVKLDQAELEDFLPEEILPPYSGAHLGGGTDSSLGWRSRFAVRGAWIAQNLSSGGVVPGSSGRSKEVAVPDSAWLEAERLLAYALAKAATGSSQQAKNELLVLLADLRSRLAGPRGLSDSRRNYEQLIGSVRDGRSDEDRARLLLYEARLAEVDARIGVELLGSKGDPESAAKYSQHARSRLSNLLQSFTGEHKHAEQAITASHIAAESPPSAAAASTGTVTSWLARVPFVTNAGTNAGSTESDSPEASDSHDQISSGSMATRLLSQPPVLQRSIITAELALASLCAGSGDLGSARTLLQTTKQALLQLAGSMLETGGRSSLHHAWLQSRTSTTLASLGEVTFAVLSRSGLEAYAAADELLLQAQKTNQSISAGTLQTASTPSLLLRQNIQRTGLLAEVLATRSRGALKELAGGDTTSALAFYEAALGLLSSDVITAKYAQSLWSDTRNRLLADVRRCREKLRSG